MGFALESFFFLLLFFLLGIFHHLSVNIINSLDLLPLNFLKI